MGADRPSGQPEEVVPQINPEILIFPEVFPAASDRPAETAHLSKAARRKRLLELMSTEMLQKVQDNFSAAVGVSTLR